MDMKEMLYSFSSQLTEGWECARSIELGHGIVEHISVVGMGGSALPGDFLRAYSDRAFTNVTRDYDLQPMPPHTLYAFISYSGNTEETVSAFESAVNRKLPCVVITSGGNLLDLARVHGIPHVEVRKGLAPRLALPLLSAALLSICNRARILNVREDEIRDAARMLDSSSTSASEFGRALSSAFYMRIPLFYASARNEIIAKAGKIALNENSKTQAFYSVIPEMNHNEINGFDVLNGQFSAVFIYDNDDHPQNEKRMRLTQQMLSERGVPAMDIKLPQENRIFKILYAIQSFYWASYYLAGRYNVDPLGVPIVEQLKKQL
ncbi:MAG: bifunctional phosphoglucose/phosphomannose isomerase [Candidatus Micrarchaeota archaeon]|nr:bifunctional phosphoglucose/phosphomannose isomerase [Candidatus Micrarchaeota archaeon]